MVEDLVEGVVDEADANGAEQRAVPAEDVVGEHRVDMVGDAERAGKVQRRLDDEQIGDRAEPQHQVRRVVVASQPDDRVAQCQHGADDHGDFQDRQGPVLQG